MQFWIHDVKFSANFLWKNKAFAAAVVLYPGCLYCSQFRHLGRIVGLSETEDG